VVSLLTAKSTLYRWAPPFLWMGLIFFMSTTSFSSDITKGFIYPILKFFFPYASENVLKIFHAIIRKDAHFIEYCILSLLFFRALLREKNLLSAHLLSLLFSFLYAVSDEYHQSFVLVRTASPIDVAIDTLGAAFMQAALWFHRKF